MDKHAVKEATSSAQDHPLLTGSIVAGAGFIGYKVFHDEVVAGAYDALKKDGAFDDFYDPYVEGLQEKTAATRDAAIAGNNPKDFPEDIAKRRKDYFEKVESRKQEMSVKGIRDEWKIAQRSFRDTAVLKGVGIASVTLGSTLALAQFFLKRGTSAEPQTSAETLQR